MVEAESPPLRFYRMPPPASPDAYRIWNECCLADIAEVTDIYWALDTWARLNCKIEMRGERPYVCWNSPTGAHHECFADTFSHWFLCACEEFKPQARAPQPLTPTVDIQPTWNLETISEENPQDVGDGDAINEIVFHDIQKIGDEADNVFIETLKEELKITLSDVMFMDLEEFLTSTDEY